MPRICARTVSSRPQQARSRCGFLAVILSCGAVLLIYHAMHQVLSHDNTSKHQKLRGEDLPVWWFAPFFDQSSFGIEASTLLLGMIRSKAVEERNVWVGTTQGNCTYEYDRSMPREDFDLLDAAKQRADGRQDSIVVCHSLPFFWSRPFATGGGCGPCPPVGYTPAVAVGRAMAETDIYNKEFVALSNRMDEVWVPSLFSKEVMTASGVDSSKLRIVPIAVNTTRFDPVKTSPHPLPQGRLVFGRHRRPLSQGYIRGTPPPPPSSPPGYTAWTRVVPSNEYSPLQVEAELFQAGSDATAQLPLPPEKPFVFISTFKWEKRKGWDRLIHAYLEEFTDQDNVELYILTKKFMAGSDFSGDMYKYSDMHLGMGSHKKWRKGPTVYVISSHLEAEDYARMYRASNAYVIPTRGEGWGMPITEAMSMGIPAIVTGWSGTADFVNDSVGYTLNFSLSQVPDGEPWWFLGARWADVDVAHLRQVMRHVYEHPEEAAQRGRAGRTLMKTKYSPEVVAAAIATELQRIQGALRTGTCDHCYNSKFVATPWQAWCHKSWRGFQEEWGRLKHLVGGLAALVTIIVLMVTALLMAMLYCFMPRVWNCLFGGLVSEIWRRPKYGDNLKTLIYTGA